jgi:RNA polymerase sigma-70 factor (ECF subfamily)
MSDGSPTGWAGLELPLLVLRAQAGDAGAFRSLFDRFGPRTLAYLRGLADDDGEDLQQEVWLTVYRRLGGLADPGAFVGWLFRVTRYRAIDFLRQRRRAHEFFAEGVDVEAQPDPGGAEAPVDRESVPGLLRHLSLPHREVVILRYLDELSYAEIATILGCSVGTVRSRLHYARQRLEAIGRQALAAES